LVQTVALLKEAGIPEMDGLETEVRNLLTRTLARILLSVKRAGHGGAVLLIPRHSKKSLRIKHLVHYDKLDRILPAHMAGAAREFLCSSLIEQKFLDASRADFPEGTETGFYPLVDPEVAESFLRAIDADGPTYLELHQSIASRDKDDAVKGELGGVAFVSALSRVDGLVLLSEGLTVRGFGVEITCREEPQSVYLAGDEIASTAKLRPLDYSHYGTRHRSMMRYCHAREAAVGFVISQDGDVRAMTRVDGSLIVWENIKLQEVEVVKTPKKRYGEWPRRTP
jgi:hypothetical protein